MDAQSVDFGGMIDYLTQKHGALYQEKKSKWNKHLDIKDFKELCLGIYNDYFIGLANGRIIDETDGVLKQKKLRKRDWYKRYSAVITKSEELGEDDKRHLIERAKAWYKDPYTCLYDHGCFFTKRVDAQAIAYKLELTCAMGTYIINGDPTCVHIVLNTLASKSVAEQLKGTTISTNIKSSGKQLKEPNQQEATPQAIPCNEEVALSVVASVEPQSVNGSVKTGDIPPFGGEGVFAPEVLSNTPVPTACNQALGSLLSAQIGYFADKTSDGSKSFPIFGLKKSKLKFDRDGNSMVNEYCPGTDFTHGNNFMIRTIIEDIDLKQCSYVTIKGLTNLDFTDAAIINFIGSKINFPGLVENDATIVISPRELVQAVYPEETEYNYKDALKRIEQLYCYRIEGSFCDEDSKVTGVFKLRVFSDYILYKTGKRTAKIGLTMASTMRKAYIKAATLNTSMLHLEPAQIDHINNSPSRGLLYPLARERMELGMASIKANGQNQQWYSKYYPLAYFREFVRFVSKERYRNLATIESALNELIEMKLVVASISHDKKGFHINFYPLNQHEIKTLGLGALVTQEGSPELLPDIDS